jgi:mono/diheme cytochrome c family protein
MKTKLSVILLATLVGNVLPAISNVYGGAYDQGKSLYESKCLICHGANGKGDGPAAAALSPHPKDFDRPQFWKGNVAQKIANTIHNGHGPMPAFDLSDDEIKAITDYMSHTFKSK